MPSNVVEVGEFSIGGMKEFLDALDDLSYSNQKKVLVAALKKGAEPIRIEAGNRAPVGDTGNLSQSQMITTAGQDATIDQVSVLIGPELDAFYGLFQEIGTAFAPAQSFLLPAFNDKILEAQELIGQHLWDEIQKKFRN